MRTSWSMFTAADMQNESQFFDPAIIQDQLNWVMIMGFGTFNGIQRQMCVLHAYIVFLCMHLR